MLSARYGRNRNIWNCGRLYSAGGPAGELFKNRKSFLEDSRGIAKAPFGTIATIQEVVGWWNMK